MKVTKVCCQGCGADLQIDESIRFVTCNYCNARLEVVHDATVTHTRQLDKIERNTAQMADNLKIIELQNDLERLDREWGSQRDGLLVRGKNGQVSEPSAFVALLSGIVMIVVGVIWLGMAVSHGAPGFMYLFGFVFIGFAIAMMVTGTAKAATYQRRLGTYEIRRSQLVNRLEQEQRR
jgi:hypothetical protein